MTLPSYTIDGDTLRGLSLFTGIGGLDLAFEAASGEVVAMCERDKFCQKVLRKHWSNIPLFEDVCKLKACDVPPVDIIFGGFPCQPFSQAGRMLGDRDERYLWGEFARLIRDIRPRWVVAENVAGILGAEADRICAEMEAMDYAVRIHCYEALSVGAPHRRMRTFLWRTPQASDGTHGGANARDSSGALHLSAQAAMCPTPTVSGNYNRKGASANSGDGLATVVGGQLNPTWIEWLMGFPEGWTSCAH